MADILMSAETAAEGIAFGANGAAPLPQVLPKTDTGRRGYDGIIDAVNRLPRPLAACLALLLFLDAAIDPAGFEARMQALSAIPQPLWWLIGAVTTFFFGAREAHYLRQSNEAVQTSNP